ncbi:MAG: hypothetical protein M1824_000993 [Vezdaea acicularis]|nr:MAG: hypothetical protein M1824_000993 [Vezdaea acicularis]
MAGHDANNFTSSSSHRLATISASQALQTLSLPSSSQPISTGISQLDAVLIGTDESEGKQNGKSGGLPRGQLTEIYGPPGAGKTSLAMQASASALVQEEHVVWVGDSFPLEKTSLIVLESINTPFNIAFPRAMEKGPRSGLNGQPLKAEQDLAQWVAGRRLTVQGDFITRLDKLAATRNLAILLTSQCTTKMRLESNLVIAPAISSSPWDSGIVRRVVLLGDWPLQRDGAAGEDLEESAPTRLAGVLRARGAAHGNSGSVGALIRFEIRAEGLRGAPPPLASVPSNPPGTMQTMTTRKRKRREIAESQSEEDRVEGSEDEYGWGAEDDVADDTSNPDGHGASQQDMLEAD